jgi:predicted ArsR family transcriptional regulator
MVDLIVLNATQLEVLASLSASEVLTCLHSLGRGSATAVAKKLGKSPATALYHLRRLESVGLADTVDKRATSRRPESIYSPAAARIKLPDTDSEGLITKAVLAGIRDAMRGFAATKEREFKHVIRTQMRLSPADTQAFFAMLDAASRFAADRQMTEGGIHLHWNSVAYPDS